MLLPFLFHPPLFSVRFVCSIDSGPLVSGIPRTSPAKSIMVRSYKVFCVRVVTLLFDTYTVRRACGELAAA